VWKDRTKGEKRRRGLSIRGGIELSCEGKKRVEKKRKKITEGEKGRRELRIRNGGRKGVK
jgi:hypothetical protein